jgi:cell division protein ZapA
METWRLADSTSLDITPTPVTICGRTYHLRGEGDPDYLHHLASMVDTKMRDIAESTGTADTLKVAILAALNLADDCVRGRGETESKELRKETDRLRRMVTLLDEALEE